MALAMKVTDHPGTTNVSETGWLMIIGGFTVDGGKKREIRE